MTIINWNDGRLITLSKGEQARCQGFLSPENTYGIFFYNIAGNPSTTTMQVEFSQERPTVEVMVPGIAEDQGLAAICFIDGSKTNAVKVSFVEGQTDAQIEAMICRVNMPKNLVKDIEDNRLAINRNCYNFETLNKFFDPPTNQWYEMTCAAI
ncbi:MAG: hypothetical protein AAF598_07435 [Bacteroidota bacterium]